MPDTDTSKSHAVNRTCIPCLTLIPANHGQQIVHLSYHASQIPASHRQQIVNLAMPHTDTIESQATNHTSYHASHRYQQIPGNKTYFLPCFTQVPANHSQQIINLAMTHTDIKKPKGQIVHLTMPHTDTSKSQSTSRAFCLASHRYQQITGDESYILPCLTQIPATHRQQILHLAMPNTDTSTSQATNRTCYHASRRYQQITSNKSSILPCLTQIPSNHRQQIEHLTMPHTDTSKSQATNKPYTLPCLTQIPANHRQQVVLLTMPHTGTNKSQATNRTSYHASHRFQQITGNKS